MPVSQGCDYTIILQKKLSLEETWVKMWGYNASPCYFIQIRVHLQLSQIKALIKMIQTILKH